MKNIIVLADADERECIDFEWEENGLKFSIAKLTREERIMLFESSSRDDSLAGRRRTKQKGLKLNYGKWSKMLILKAIQGWTGMKYKHLPEILNPDKFTFESGTNPEEEIPYDEEQRRFISDMYSDDLMTFLNEATDAIHDITEQKRKDELKNSKSSLQKNKTVGR